jgi:hypothetical protein
VAKAATTGDRRWLAVFEPHGFELSAHSSHTSSTANNTYIDCQDWYTDLMKSAAQVRTEVTRATELARRDGVFPGVVRDVRREFRLEWSGW